ncbi:MAG: hypothetical protein IKO26_11465 [Paludibacteraceae bacterium]|nr:hypothetical protein [Paludibacteraceae bacterium]
MASTALSVSARNFEAGERLYFNGTPSSATWWKNGTYENTTRLWGKMVDGSDEYWIEARWYDATNCYLEIPDDANAARNWSRLVLYRCAYNNRSNVFNKTGEINLDVSASNYIQNFYYGSSKEEAYWWVIAPAPTGDPSGWSMTYDDEQICTSAAGTEYVLAPKGYNYDNSKNHAWYKYASGTWTLLDGDEFRGSEGLQDYSVILDGANSDTYYYMQAGKPSARRLLRVRLNQDCSEGAPGACKITSFAAVASDANVTDQTSAINGVVAFDDKKNAGTLQIWCPEVDTVTINNDEIETPQTFKLKGFDASSSKTYTLYAKFLGGTGECEASCHVTVNPPAVTPTTHTDTGTGSDGSHDRDLIRFTQEDVTLTPTNQTSTYFQWTNSEDETKIAGKAPDNRNLTFTAPTEEKEVVYVLLATQDPPEPAGNLIENGIFEDAVKDGDLESSYAPWGRDVSDYYTSNPGASGGYAIVKNSTDFYHTYNTVTAHEGDYFALFDSKIWDGTDQAAWSASTAKNPKLKVEAGVSYMFSFWVANINNFGEMNNGAQLQFQISYDGGSTWNNLGASIDLGDYKDNRWHGMSSITTPAAPSSNVKIRVINLNTSDQNRGNDFALDDIRFEAITANTANIAAFERFPVTYHKCVINSATFSQRQPSGCGITTADVDYTVHFLYPRGDLYIYEGTTELAHIPHSSIGDNATSYTGVIAAQAVDNADHELTVYFEDALVKTDAPTTYTYNARAVPAISVKSLEWGTPACDATTTTLTAVITYTNQNGTLSASVDGGTAVSASYIAESDDAKEVTLVIPGVVADGKTGHTLDVAFDGALGCSITGHSIPEAAPYMPAVTVHAPEVQPYACGDGTYAVKVSASFTNGQMHDIIFKDWKTGTGQQVATSTNDGTAEYTFTGYAWDDEPAAHEYNVYFAGATSCDHKTSYTSPAQPALTVTPNIINTACDQTTYSLRLDLNYTNQRGANILANVDGGTDNVKANAYIAQMSAATESIQIDGLAADGKTHRYNLRFDDAADCGKLNVEFTAPYSPQISAASAVVQPYACGESEYKVTVAADFANGQGHDLIIEDWNGNKETVHTETTDTHKEHTFAYAWETPVEHTYKVYFAGAESCADKHMPAFTAPREPKIENIASAVTPAAECDKTTYDLEVTFDYYNQDGTLSVDVDGVAAAAVTPLVANSADKQSATATFTALPADGGTHTITVKTTGGAHNCTATGTLTGVPHLPAISSVTPVIATDYACGDAQYSVTLTIAYANALGKDILVKEGSSVLKTVTANTGAGAFTEDITLDFDFGTDHTLNVCFGNREDCAQEVTVTSPAQPALTVTPKVIHTDCEKNYDLDVEIKYTNQDGTLSVDVDGVAADPATLVFVPNSATGQTLTAKVKGLPADGGTHVLNVAFTGGIHSCAASPVDITAPLTSAVTSVSVGAVPLTVLCDETSYTVPVIVEMPYDPVIGKNLIVVHEGISETVAITANPMTADIAMTTTDAAGLTIEAYIEGAPACKAVSAAFDAPARLSCIKDAATVCAGESYTWPHTGITYGPFATEGQDTVVNALNPGDSLFVTVLPLPQITLNAAGTVYEDDAEIRLPYTVTGGAPNLFNVTINSVASSHKRTTEDAIVITRPASVTAGDYTVTVDVLDTLTGCQSSAGIVVNVIERPVEPVIAIKNVVPSVPADCETTLSVTFDADYTNLPAAFTYWLDSDKAAEQTAAVVTGDKNARTVTGLTIGNIPADGKDHKIHVQFADTDNGKDSATFTTPLTHAIEAVTVSGVPATILCNELPYFVSVAVTLPYDTAGIKLVLHFEGRDTAVYTGAANPTNFILPMRTTNTTGLSVTARYCDAPACLITGNSFDAPTRLGCVKDYVDICEGESYTWQHNGVTYSPKTLGEHKYNEGFDSLFLTVRAQPAVKIYPSGRVCDDDAEVRWAYAVTQGTPDVFSVQIDGKDYDLTATAEELVLAMPAGLQPGDYTATFTIGDAAISCTSTAQAEMTVAAGDLIYSKWSDLLFIDNSGKQFTAYQWYENGNILIDETRQYLFRTGGLPNEYFCRLTTTDGSTIYTCAMTFDEAIPSRTVTSEGGETTSVKMYDPVGRIVSGKLSNGIYIVLEEVGGEKIVRKVAVFE